MNSTSESLLLRLKAADDHQAWAKFVRLYTPLIFYWARRIGLQAQDAADLVQDVLTIVFQKLPEFEYDRDKSFRAWLRTVTMNKFRQWCRKKSLGALDVTQTVWSNIAEQSSLAESTWDLNYRQELVARALDLLEPEFQPATWQALKQYVLSGGPAGEIATEHGLSVWTLYAAKSRLLARMREELDGLID